MSPASNGGIVPQTWRCGCHGCGARTYGVAESRDEALSLIEAWKSEHRLTLGCSASPMWHLVSGVPSRV